MAFLRQDVAAGGSSFHDVEAFRDRGRSHVSRQRYAPVPTMGCADFAMGRSVLRFGVVSMADLTADKKPQISRSS